MENDIRRSMLQFYNGVFWTNIRAQIRRGIFSDVSIIFLNDCSLIKTINSQENLLAIGENIFTGFLDHNEKDKSLNPKLNLGIIYLVSINPELNQEIITKCLGWQFFSCFLNQQKLYINLQNSFTKDNLEAIVHSNALQPPILTDSGMKMYQFPYL